MVMAASSASFVVQSPERRRDRTLTGRLLLHILLQGGGHELVAWHLDGIAQTHAADLNGTIVRAVGANDESQRFGGIVDDVGEGSAS